MAAAVNATGGMAIKEFYVDNDIISFSNTKLIYNYQSKTGGYVYDHVGSLVVMSTVQCLTRMNHLMNQSLVRSIWGGALTESDSLELGANGMWAKRSKTVRVWGNGTVELTVIDLDPFTLKPFGSPTVTRGYMTGDFAIYSAWSLGSGESEELLRFRSFIVGHFDNSKQVAMEISVNGTAVHPLSEQVSDVATQKIDNLPAGFDKDGRYFILEETYFTQDGKPPMAQPMLFLFSPNERGQVTIVSYKEHSGF